MDGWEFVMAHGIAVQYELPNKAIHIQVCRHGAAARTPVIVHGEDLSERAGAAWLHAHVALAAPSISRLSEHFFDYIEQALRTVTGGNDVL
jgi:hypothetical protein